jgi:hypothetical protein
LRRESIVFPFNAKTSDMSATGSTCEAAAVASAMSADPGSLQARPLNSAVTGRRVLNIARVRLLPEDEQNWVAEFPLDFASRMRSALHDEHGDVRL